MAYSYFTDRHASPDPADDFFTSDTNDGVDFEDDDDYNDSNDYNEYNDYEDEDTLPQDATPQDATLQDAVQDTVTQTPDVLVSPVVPSTDPATHGFPEFLESPTPSTVQSVTPSSPIITSSSVYLFRGVMQPKGISAWLSHVQSKNALRSLTSSFF